MSDDLSEAVIDRVKEQLEREAQVPDHIKTADWISTRAGVLARLEPDHHAFIAGLTELGLEPSPFPFHRSNTTHTSIPTPASPAVTVILNRQLLAQTSPAIDARTPAALDADTDTRRTVTTLGTSLQTVHPAVAPGVTNDPLERRRALRLVPPTGDHDERSR